MATLFAITITHGPNPGQRTELEQRSLLIGRDPACDLVINDLEVSRRHARLIALIGGFAIEDLGSTNGTFVDEQRITEVMPLKDGAMIRFGDSVRLAYEAGRVDEAKTQGLPLEPRQAAAPAPGAGLEVEPGVPSARRRPRRKGLRLPIFSKPWMLILVTLISFSLCMAVFLFFVDAFNLWCSWFGWAISACA